MTRFYFHGLPAVLWSQIAGNLQPWAVADLRETCSELRHVRAAWSEMSFGEIGLAFFLEPEQCCSKTFFRRVALFQCVTKLCDASPELWELCSNLNSVSSTKDDVDLVPLHGRALTQLRLCFCPALDLVCWSESLKVLDIRLSCDLTNAPALPRLEKLYLAGRRNQGLEPFLLKLPCLVDLTLCDWNRPRFSAGWYFPYQLKKLRLHDYTRKGQPQFLPSFVYGQLELEDFGYHVVSGRLANFGGHESQFTKWPLHRLMLHNINDGVDLSLFNCVHVKTLDLVFNPKMEFAAIKFPLLPSLEVLKVDGRYFDPKSKILKPAKARKEIVMNDFPSGLSCLTSIVTCADTLFAIAQLVDLIQLDLSFNETEVALDPLSSCLSLRDLCLRHWRHASSARIKWLTAMTSLTILRFRNC